MLINLGRMHLVQLFVKCHSLGTLNPCSEERFIQFPNLPMLIVEHPPTVSVYSVFLSVQVIIDDDFFRALVLPPVSDFFMLLTIDVTAFGFVVVFSSRGEKSIGPNSQIVGW